MELMKNRTPWIISRLSGVFRFQCKDAAMPNSAQLKASWFAPWKWNRWTWIVVLPLAIVAYFLSAVPILHLVIRNRSTIDPVLSDAAVVFYQPVWNCGNHIAPAKVILDWEHQAMFAALGQPRADELEEASDGLTVKFEKTSGRTYGIEIPAPRPPKNSN